MLLGGIDICDQHAMSVVDFSLVNYCYFVIGIRCAVFVWANPYTKPYGA